MWPSLLSYSGFGNVDCNMIILLESSFAQVLLCCELMPF